MFRTKVKVNPFNVGDLVVFKRDKNREVHKVDFISDEFCNVKVAKTNELWGWVRAKNLRLLSAVSKKKRR